MSRLQMMKKPLGQPQIKNVVNVVKRKSMSGGWNRHVHQMSLQQGSMNVQNVETFTKSTTKKYF